MHVVAVLLEADGELAGVLRVVAVQEQVHPLVEVVGEVEAELDGELEGIVGGLAERGRMG